eukprot:12149057-Ditylum_brightwellii.AAC.1
MLATVPQACKYVMLGSCQTRSSSDLPTIQSMLEKKRQEYHSGTVQKQVIYSGPASKILQLCCEDALNLR